MKFNSTDPDVVKAFVQAYSQIPQLVLDDLAELLGPDGMESMSYHPGMAFELVAFREGIRNVLLHIKKRRERVALLLPEQERPT